jgi:glucoamylase
MKIAFGSPGMWPKWTSGSKQGIGTAFNKNSHVWFTLSHGIVSEIYYPTVDCPNTRDFQFLITDGETFCHEERRDLQHEVGYPRRGALYYRPVSSDREGRYRLVKEIITDPSAPVVLLHARLEILEEKLRDKLHVYALLAPHLKRHGSGNNGYVRDVAGHRFFYIECDNIKVMLGCSPDFTRRSVGYVGQSDGWQDLKTNFRMDYEFDCAENGNIALTGEVDLTQGSEFTIGLGFGSWPHGAAAKLAQSLAIPFEHHKEIFINQWGAYKKGGDQLNEHTGDGGRLLHLSECILLAHEDKIFQGAFVASMSMPWGETKGDDDVGGYHLVWPRDMVEIATALLAKGHLETALRGLIWLACIQQGDGSMPQNSWVTGDAYWRGKQLDEVVAPILLAWRAKEAGSLEAFDPWALVSRAAAYVVQHAPVTAQDRWEENSGYSPSTLAGLIAGLVCAAEFARARGSNRTADFLLDYADWLSVHVEDWTVTDRGELLAGVPRHYIRINPADPRGIDVLVDPNEAMLDLRNGSGCHPARNVVASDFLHLVRLGVRDAQSALIRDSIAVVDQVIKVDLPGGSSWRRYNHDGYGQKRDGGAFDGTGIGGAWPLLTGERGHYEIAAGRDPMPFIRAMENFSNEAGMLAEQLWWMDDDPSLGLFKGRPVGSAMPLCWAHAEYVSLVCSSKAGRCVARIEPVYQRYVVAKAKSVIEMWTFDYQTSRIACGKTLRIITPAPATLRWSFDGWATPRETELTDAGINCWFADLAAQTLPMGTKISFTFRWENRWEGKDFGITVGP